MKSRGITGLLAAAHLFSSALGAGTTVLVYESYCPAPATSLATGPGVTSGTPAPAPQYFLFVATGFSVTLSKERRDAGPSYLSLGGSTTRNCHDAATYTITLGGQLMSSGELVSTSGLVHIAPFAPSSNTAAISTTFSVNNGVLSWNSTAFTGNQALFCQTGSTIDAVFNGQLPSGCGPVTLGLVLVSPSSCPGYPIANSSTGNVPTIASTSTTSVAVSKSSSSSPTSPTGGSSSLGSFSASGVVADLIGGFAYRPTATVLFGPNERISNLEQCLTFCVGYMYFGVSEGSLCTCGSVIAAGSMPATYGSCSVPCPGNVGELCGGSICIVIFGYRGMGSTSTSTTSTAITSTTSTSTTALITESTSIISSTLILTSSLTATTLYPTSTGTPNCLDRSPFTGTVNGDYLILCDTGLPGYDLVQVNGADLADCIAACSSYLALSSPQEEPCVAVEYDQNASTDACHLKYTIGTVSSGGNATAQAAILVNQPNGPPIIYSTMNSTPSITTATSTTGSTTVQTIVANISTSTVPTTTTSNDPIVAPSISPTTSSSALGLSPMPSPSVDSTSPLTIPVISASSMSSNGNAPPSTSSSTASLSGMFLTLKSISAGPPSSSTASPFASATALCPGSNHQIISQGLASYEIECSEQLLGNVLTGNTTTALSLQQCYGFCNLLNLAQPFGCVGVNYLKTLQNLNCLFLSTVTGYLSNPSEDAGRLIYAGYPSVTDVPLSISSTVLLSSSSTIASPSLPATSISTFSSILGTSIGNRPTSSSVGPTITGILPLTAASSTAVSSSTILSTATSSSSSAASSAIASSSATSSSAVVHSSTALSSTAVFTTISFSSATLSSACLATASTSIAPIPTSALCPGTPGGTVYGVSFSGTGTGSGTLYEIECSTNFAGVLDQPTLALSLQDCINTCQQYKYSKQLPCYAVSFNNSDAALTLPPQNNCYLYANVTSITHGVSQFDSARIVSNSSGYANVNDYCFTPGLVASSTPAGVVGGQSSLVPGAGPVSSNSANAPAKTTTTSGNTAQTGMAGPSLCPASNFTVVQDGNYEYEIECGFQYGGQDIGKPPGYTAGATNIDSCVLQCNYWNDNPSLGETCIYALYAGPPLNGCYNKNSVTGTRAQTAGYNVARLIYSAYPSPTDLS